MIEYDSNGVSIDNDPNWMASGRYVGAHRSDYKPKPTITVCEYGTYAHGEPYHVERGQYNRFDTYQSRKEGDTDLSRGDRVSLASRTDDSPIYLGKYDSRCACCYLNHAHSTEQHSLMVVHDSSRG